MRIRFVLRCGCLFLIMTGTITMSVYRHSNARSVQGSVRSRDHSPGSLHGIVAMKQYQQNYNSTPGPNTIE